MTLRIRILLVEDHNLMRAGLRALLDQMPGVEVVAEADNGRTALLLANEFVPDIVLMDVSMPGLNGLDATRQLVKQNPQTRVIILSNYDSEVYVWQALNAGAAGYLLKSLQPTELELALAAVAKGEIALSPAVSRSIVSDYLRHGASERHPLDRLTTRQREILQLIAEGNSSKQIADSLSISVKTVLTHRAQIMERLGVQDMPGLVRYAMRAGLVQPIE